MPTSIAPAPRWLGARLNVSCELLGSAESQGIGVRGPRVRPLKPVGRLIWSTGSSPPIAPTNSAWGDITYIRTFSGWVYAAFVIDVFSRMVVGCGRCPPRCTRRWRWTP